MKEVEDSVLEEGILLAIKNSKQFVKDSRILLKAGSIGHSLGLAELALEELGRAGLLFGCRLGMTDFSETLKDLKSHEIKILAFCGLLIGMDPELRQEWQKQMEKASKDILQTKEEFIRTLEDRYKELMSELNAIKEDRHVGFYVDYNTGGWIDPSIVEKDEVIERLNLIKRLLSTPHLRDIKKAFKEMPPRNQLRRIWQTLISTGEKMFLDKFLELGYIDQKGYEEALRKIKENDRSQSA